jgi:hypothetical protein
MSEPEEPARRQRGIDEVILQAALLVFDSDLNPFETDGQVFAVFLI